MINDLINSIGQLNKLQKPFLDKVLADLSTEDYYLMNKYLEFLVSQGLSIDYIAGSYNFLVLDTMKEQIYFKKNKKYRFSTYSEVADRVYHNSEYMSKYMYGLAVSQFLWKNHLELRKYFELSLPREQKGKYLEIGPGHGLNFMFALKNASYDIYEGVDVSETSINLTRNMISSGVFGVFSNYKLYLKDFFNFDNQDIYQAVIMNEVLEHVENPIDFLLKIKEITNEESFIFITTPVNSPMYDHLYLFESVEDIQEMIQGCNFSIVKKLILPYSGKSVDACIEEKLPIRVAMVLQNIN